MTTRIKLLVVTELLALCVTTACDDNSSEDQIPPAIVNETINLTNQQYQNLQFIGGHTTIAGGVRGIILYRASSDEYRAFERNCSFQPLESCARVMVESSGLFMIDTCCNSSFDFSGFPTGGPATLPLRVYNTLLEGDFLQITN